MTFNITGTLIKPDGTPYQGCIYFTLNANTQLLNNIALKTICKVALDSSGSFSIDLVPGEYCVTLPNLTKSTLTVSQDSVFTLGA